VMRMDHRRIAELRLALVGDASLTATGQGGRSE
jgi:hypothetical protein